MFVHFKGLSAVLACALSISCLSAIPASAKFEDLPRVSSFKSVSIFSNSGGSIGQFAFRAAKLRSTHTLVKFAGRCDSACTLFLGLPSKQMCVSHGAFFRFHAPTHPSAQAARFAENYMMRKYPSWVRSWISKNHGLSHRLLTMNYEYASRYMHTCVA